MKKWMMAVAATVAMASAAWGDVGLGVLAGFWNTDDFDEHVDGFGGVTARVEAELLPVLGVEARLNAYGVEDDWATSIDGKWVDCDFWTDVLSVEAGLTGKLPLGLLTLYGGGGVGAYFLDGRLDLRFDGRKHRVDLEYDTEVGAYAFGGLEIALGPNVALVGEVRYTWLETSLNGEMYGRPVLDEKPDVTLDGLGVEVGLMFWL